MSTQLVFYRNGWLKEGKGGVPQPTSIERSLAELDTLLSLEDDEIRAESATPRSSVEHLQDEARSTGSSRKSTNSGDNSNMSGGLNQSHGDRRKSELEKHHERRRRSTSTGTGSPNRRSPASPHSPHRRGNQKSDCDDAKSVSSSTIHSRDVTVHSNDLIANLDQLVADADVLSSSNRSTPNSPARRSMYNNANKNREDALSKSLPGSPTRSLYSRSTATSTAPSTSPRSRRSRRSSSSNRSKRGDSLERDISRTILQLTSDSSQFVVATEKQQQEPAAASSSITDILKDLMGSAALVLPSFAQTEDAGQDYYSDADFSVDETEIGEFTEQHHNRSHLHTNDRHHDDIDEQDSSDVDDYDNQNGYLQVMTDEGLLSSETADTGEASDSSTGNDYLTNEELLSSDFPQSKCATFEAVVDTYTQQALSRDMMIEAPNDNDEEEDVDTITALPGIVKSDRTVGKLVERFAAGLENNFHESLADLCIPEESESDIMESYASTNATSLVLVAPLMELHRPPLPPSVRKVPVVVDNDEDHFIVRSAGCISPFKVVNTLADTAIINTLANTTCHTTMEDSFGMYDDEDSDGEEDDDDDDDDWTTFGESVFSDTFRPASPTETSPESPTSVFKLAAEADLSMTEIPDEGHAWQQTFPKPTTTSDDVVEWEQFNRRFAI